MRQYGIILSSEIEHHIPLWLSKRLETKRVFSYRIPWQQIGRKVEIELVGFGFDTDNAGFQVRVPVEVEHYSSYPRYITTSLSERGMEDNTAKLEFTPMEPIRLVGTLGFIDVDGGVITDGAGASKPDIKFTEPEPEEEW